MTRPTGEDEMSSEHVEVLRDLSEVCRAAIKAGDWKVDGACDPDSLLRHADAAIASLSAPQSDSEWVLVPKDAIERAIETLENDGDEHGEGRNLRAMLDAAPQPPAEAQPVYVGVDLEGGWIRAPTPEAQGGGEVEYEFEVWQDNSLQAGGSTSDYATAKSEADHYALMYGQDGPVEVRMYLKRHITAPPSAPVGVEWPLSLLRAGHWREVYIGHRCMRLEVTYDYATWERLMAEVESALAPQPPAEAQPVDSGVFDKVIEDALRYGTGTLRVEHVPYDDFRMPPSAPVGVADAALMARLDTIHQQVFGKPYPTEALAQQPAALHTCSNCEGVSPESCLFNQHPAAVDGAMARRLDDYLGGEFDIRIGKQAAHAALHFALTGQQGGRSDD